ncbi:MAG: hypothetical protein ACK2U9_21045, partial [Anaerolineae bacterium]
RSLVGRIEVDADVAVDRRPFLVLSGNGTMRTQNPERRGCGANRFRATHGPSLQLAFCCAGTPVGRQLCSLTTINRTQPRGSRRPPRGSRRQQQTPGELKSF